ncbi:hypothetical protein OV320_7854 [Actinobacteria bacterium OV320]|nr:hypothetical protein OV320_7854 [Actinobacteria bacterium OV320]
MPEENVEVEVEMVEPEEGVMVDVPDENEGQEPEAETEVEPEVEEEPVEEAPKKVKRPVRTPKVKAPVEEPAEEAQDEPEAVEEESEEEEAEEETVADLAAVLARLEAIEALLTAEPGETEPVVDEEAVSRAEAAELKLLAFKVGTRHGLSETLIERLRGEDEESLTEDAVKLSGETGSGGGGLGKGGLDPDEDVFDPKKFIKNLRKQNNGGL